MATMPDCLLPFGREIRKLTPCPSSEVLTSFIVPDLSQQLLAIFCILTESPSSNVSALLFPCFLAAFCCFWDQIRIKSSCFNSFLISIGRLVRMCLQKNLCEGLPLPSWAWCWLMAKTAVLKFLSVKLGIFSSTSLIDLTVLSAGALLLGLK